MKKIIALLLVAVFALSTIPAFAGEHPSSDHPKALEKASDDSVIDKAGDWFATRGKSGKEKQDILAERKAKRAAKRAEKAAKKAQKKAQKAAEKANKDMKKKVKGFGKK